VKIKLFVCCHQSTDVPKHPLLVPLQVGAALTSERFPGFLYDDSGDNISVKNRSYCELTGQYWAWKNVEADHYGFFHYRRYLYPDMLSKRPYRIEQEPTAALLDRLNYNEFAELISQYDMILPKRENMYISVREHYSGAAFHHEKDLAMAEQILITRYPEYTHAATEYLSGTNCYFGNIFIASREVFQNYCSWLYPILEEFDFHANISGYSHQEQRVNGYLAERLLGIYRTYRQDKLRILELPGIHFFPGGTFIKQRALNLLLPPGSRQRAEVKKLMHRKGR